MPTHSLITMRETLGSSPLGRSTDSNGATFKPTVRVRGFVTEFNLEYAFKILEEYVNAYNKRFPLMLLRLDFIGYADLGMSMPPHLRKTFGTDLIEDLVYELIDQVAESATQPEQTKES